MPKISIDAKFDAAPTMHKMDMMTMYAENVDSSVVDSGGLAVVLYMMLICCLDQSTMQGNSRKLMSKINSVSERFGVVACVHVCLRMNNAELIYAYETVFAFPIKPRM